MNDRPADTDSLDRFLLPRAGVRGVRVHLGGTWEAIRSRDTLSPGAATLLGEACAAAALFTGHAKVEGRLSVHLRGQGALRTLFAECTAAGTLRGIVRLADDGATLPSGLRDAAASAILAITVENPGTGNREPQRYQGLVEIAADSLSEAFEGYFHQSEQLPTRLLLAADGHAAAGLMLQKLPGDQGDADGWDRASALFDTLRPAELLAWPGATLLHRLFHEEAPEPLGARPLRFGCSCSRGRVAEVLRSLGQEEAGAAVIDGLARIHCEFCGQAYEFDRDAVDALFTATGAPMDAPHRLQ
ncbi:Hsp33 family molecular chaperone HslO [Luteimonas sp. RD2P54]|uniref:Hsp33 family molecular chaperone HslO n=1 Tax=Luteimonas endophytica TaxID=3042023 RepID=A0ABT6JBI3_9GAMM|nr:Hsp33 family molecular chaperone HslO [Luteimonas endophytica]MDH5823538.1 Hsp33 family molecular chaperone HslO [Luteimonas endophytica]